MIIDTHSHYDDEDFDADRDELIRSLPSHGIEIAVDVGASMASSAATLRLAQHYPHIYAAAGVHPAEVRNMTEEDIQALREMTVSDRVVAVGEIGLDYHYKDEYEVPKDIQKHWFIRQLDLARETGLPVIIHSRDAAQDTMDIMKEHYRGISGGVVHCYSYDTDQAAEYLKMGLFFGIGGVVTYKNAKKLVRVVEMLPVEAIVLETDCPYLAPVPHRGERNSSLYLPLMAGKIAEIKGMTAEEVISITRENALRLYPKIGKKA